VREVMEVRKVREVWQVREVKKGRGKEEDVRGKRG
jgi:hypothetical protein